jgi:hypothetical protein
VSFAGTTTVHGDVVTDWNAISLRCVQGGPGAAANRTGAVGLLDIALVQAAVHDAVQAIEGRYQAYRYSTPGAGSTSAAVAAASYGVLVGLYGADDPCLVGVANPAATYAGDAGLLAGSGAAAALLLEYRPTFVSPLDPFTGGTGAGEWRPTPNVSGGAATFMALTQPFTLKNTRQFRPQPPPPMVSKVYSREFEEVKSLGSLTGSTRTQRRRTWRSFGRQTPSPPGMTRSAASPRPTSRTSATARASSLLRALPRPTPR